MRTVETLSAYASKGSPPWRRYLPLSTEVVSSLKFAPAIRALADTIVRKITNNFQIPFNGIHLRLEMDGLSAWALHQNALEVL